MSEDAGKLTLELSRLETLLVKLATQQALPGSCGTANINISAGGVGIWVSVTCCVATFTALLVGVIFVAIGMADLNRQTQEIRATNETQQAYINAGYVQPQESAK